MAMVGEGNDVTFNPSPDIIHGQKSIYGSWVTSLWRMEELVEHLVRWDIPLAERNIPVYKADVQVAEDGSVSYGKSEVYRINLRSCFLPVPFTDMQRAPGLVQNEGWSSWSRQ